MLLTRIKSTNQQRANTEIELNTELELCSGQASGNARTYSNNTLHCMFPYIWAT